MTNFATWAFCGLDFVRAVNARPLLAKLLFRIVCGKYAFREFTLLVNAINRDGYEPFMDYGCEGCDYHEDPQPWIWWKPEHYAPYIAAIDEGKK